MTDNVIILGAGASVDAGIPLLTNFVDKMWEIATLGTYKGQALSDEDKKIFSEAMKVRNELDGYHGRASFDDRNIEDILSILTFNMLGGKRSDREKLNWIVKAITRTIELTCTLKHNGDLKNTESQEGFNSIYRLFWENMFDRFYNQIDSFPSIISFNYDLVLERSLFQTLIRIAYGARSEASLFPFDGVILQYHYELVNPLTYRIIETIEDYPLNQRRETVLEWCDSNDLARPLNIELLKLHGSLNFPTNSTLLQRGYAPTISQEIPYIIPPTINKSISKNEQAMWSTGLKRLREAKNIIIVGYSLPQTDIYMQYFIKAGIGPNINLNKIYVFNPVLYRDGKENDQMKERFGNCFSSQLKNRIEFQPNPDGGTFAHFIDSIRTDGNLFFTRH